MPILATAADQSSESSSKTWSPNGGPNISTTRSVQPKSRHTSNLANILGGPIDWQEEGQGGGSRFEER